VSKPKKDIGTTAAVRNGAGEVGSSKGGVAVRWIWRDGAEEGVVVGSNAVRAAGVTAKRRLLRLEVSAVRGT